MKPRRKLNRRSFMQQVAGGIAAGGGALTLLAARAKAQPVTDRDPTDPVGQGRGGGTGITDSDAGDGADPAGRGRGGGAAAQDSDVSDRAGSGRRPPSADYVDCQRTRERLAEVERTIALVEDEGRLAAMQNDLAQARALADQAERGDLFADRDIQQIIEGQGVSCQFSSGTGCISRLEAVVDAALRARQDPQVLYTERARLWADLQRGC